MHWPFRGPGVWRRWRWGPVGKGTAALLPVWRTVAYWAAQSVRSHLPTFPSTRDTHTCKDTASNAAKNHRESSSARTLLLLRLKRNGLE
uniref:Putative secreted protein n=1 Tax=Anopheles darlingi TaxID=43151 RepID=A0A2M4D268_ANODA